MATLQKNQEEAEDRLLFVMLVLLRGKMSEERARTKLQRAKERQHTITAQVENASTWTISSGCRAWSWCESRHERRETDDLSVLVFLVLSSLVFLNRFSACSVYFVF